MVVGRATAAGRPPSRLTIGAFLEMAALNAMPRVASCRAQHVLVALFNCPPIARPHTPPDTWPQVGRDQVSEQASGRAPARVSHNRRHDYRCLTDCCGCRFGVVEVVVVVVWMQSTFTTTTMVVVEVMVVIRLRECYKHQQLTRLNLRRSQQP